MTLSTRTFGLQNTFVVLSYPVGGTGQQPWKWGTVDYVDATHDPPLARCLGPGPCIVGVGHLLLSALWATSRLRSPLSAVGVVTSQSRAAAADRFHGTQLGHPALITFWVESSRA